MKRLDLKKCVVTLPDKNAGPAVVVYGELLGWEGDWFLKHNKIPASTFESIYFILPIRFTNRCKDCMDEFRASVDPKTVGRYSLCGFSRGGSELLLTARPRTNLEKADVYVINLKRGARRLAARDATEAVWMEGPG